ncbi:hypothetical protein [Rathayibacter festucae]|uniref:hypothetical protein n=1 Tax=Rathayibacter festucae TaxID=110937 RepID=UPI002A6B51B8|nr:hypothetical protein [Rathayibacter festucae]MDY0912258.1 hypothetical protein [Rathayibacter festucae]
MRREGEARAERRSYRDITAPNENPPAPAAVWYFVGATFVAALPMILFPDLPWPVRLGSLALALALIAGGSRQLRREKRDAVRRTDEPPRAQP